MVTIVKDKNVICSDKLLTEYNYQLTLGFVKEVVEEKHEHS